MICRIAIFIGLCSAFLWSPVNGAGQFLSNGDNCYEYNTGYAKYDYTTRTYTTTRFELLHADFHGHIAQYLHAMVPPHYRGSAGYQLIVTVKNTGGYSEELCRKSNLQADEAVLLQNGTLPQGNYTLTAVIADNSNTVAEEITETFAKPYDGIPRVGIDENNAICMEGKPFFPITPFGMPLQDAFLWTSNGYINSLCRGPWGDNIVYNVNEMKLNLDIAERLDAPFIGPESWPNKPSGLNTIAEYVTAFKDRPGLFMWFWHDEPNLGGTGQNITGPQVRSWTQKCHALDPQHLVYMNYAGKTWTTDHLWYVQRRGEYNYLINEDQFNGKKTFVADVQAFDYYPIDWRISPYGNASMQELIKGIKTFKAESYDLIPHMYFIETCDIGETATAAPTPEQLRMLCWLHVVLETKGLQWFHHFHPTPPENLAVMGEFNRQITELTPVVLGPRPEITATDNANTPGNQVEVMVREHNGAVYVFAVRVSEVLEANAPPITVSITLNGGLPASQAEVYEEGRTVAITGNSLTDTFAPNAVHIYKIGGQSNIYYPSSDRAVKATPGLNGRRHLKLYDLAGREVLKAGAAGTMYKNAARLNSGVYLLKEDQARGIYKAIVITK